MRGYTIILNKQLAVPGVHTKEHRVHLLRFIRIIVVLNNVRDAVANKGGGQQSSEKVLSPEWYGIGPEGHQGAWGGTWTLLNC
eukprot:365228-Chlamydomonas_euryale.AAC.32